MITDGVSLHLQPEDWPPIDPTKGFPVGLQCACRITDSHLELGESDEVMRVVDAFEILSIDYIYEEDRE